MIELERIDFKNGSSGKTPLNKTNLNKLQDNIENAINKEVERQDTLREDGDLVRKIKISGASEQEGTPSIESEAPIESVGDNINIYNENGETTTSYFDNTGKLVTVADIFNKIEIEPIYTQYVMSHAGIKGVAYVRFSYFNGDTFISREVSEVSGHVFTVPVNCTKIDIRVNNDSKGFTDLKLEKGTKATPYSPYGQGSIEIYNCNKNFWKINNASFTPTVSSWHDFNGISNMYNNSQYNKSKAKIKLKAGNYYISYGEMANIGTVQTIKIDGSTNGVVLVTGKGAFTLTEDSEIIIRLSVSTANVKASISNVQIVSGTEEKEYIEHQSQTKALYTQQPFRAIGDVKDRFVKKNCVEYEEHPIVRHIFTGNENWSLQTEKEITNVYKYYNTSVFPNNRTPLLSNYFIDKVDTGDVEGIIIQQNQIYLAINKETAPTLDDFKAKLTELYNAGTPVYVDYVLATPTLIPCTPEQVEVLNDIYSAYGEGMTNIICNDKIEPVIEIVKETKETVQSENDKAISMLLARIEELEKKIQ